MKSKKEDLKIKFKFNDTISEEEGDEIFFKIFDVIFASSEPKDVSQLQHANTYTNTKNI